MGDHRPYGAHLVERGGGGGRRGDVLYTGDTPNFPAQLAMHMLYAGTPLKTLQSLLGRKSAKSTEIYTRVFALDVAARHRVLFQIPGSEAINMLKSIRNYSK